MRGLRTSFKDDLRELKSTSKGLKLKLRRRRINEAKALTINQEKLATI